MVTLSYTFFSPGTLAASQLTKVSKVKDLGVYLDTKSDFRRHIDRVIARCRSTLGLVKRFAKEFGDLEVAKALYRALRLVRAGQSKAPRFVCVATVQATPGISGIRQT